MPNILNNREIDLVKTATEAGIISLLELSNFMAQCSVESNRLQSVNESFRYSKNIQQIRNVVASTKKISDEDLENARQASMNGEPEQLADYMYGNRLGNNQIGDGYKYRGRGYIQLTGKENYARFGELIGHDLLNNPDLASEPHIASLIALAYWNKRVPENAKENVTAATHAINGGENGLHERIEQSQQWLAILTPERIQNIMSGLEVGSEIA